MAQMEFTVQGAQSVQKQLETHADTLATAKSTLDKNIAATQDWWIGDTGKAFNDQYEEFKPSLDDLYKLVVDLNEQMTQVISVMQKYDEEGAKRYGGVR